MATRVIEPELITDPSSPPLTSAQIAVRVQRLEWLTKLLDEAIEVPFVKQKVGFDALVGLAPIVGDVITGLTAAWIVYEAKQLGASNWLVARMSWNVLADVLGGAVPIAGDLFDAWFKANRKNVDMLKAHLREAGHDLGPVKG